MLKSQDVTLGALEDLQHCHWIFTNIAGMIATCKARQSDLPSMCVEIPKNLLAKLAIGNNNTQNKYPKISSVLLHGLINSRLLITDDI